MNPCKHGHVDGVMHRPCKSCRIEYLEALVAEYEKVLPPAQITVAKVKAMRLESQKGRLE